MYRGSTVNNLVIYSRLSESIKRKTLFRFDTSFEHFKELLPLWNNINGFSLRFDLLCLPIARRCTQNISIE